jgi:hypothetical protein
VSLPIRRTGGRRAWLVCARRPAVALLLIFAVAGAGAVASSGVAHPGPPAGASCRDAATRVECRDITVDGRVWRYSLTRATRPTDRTVIVDFGGPGLDVLSGPQLPEFLADHRALAANHNVLVLEEPWVTQPPTPDCRRSLSAFYLAARSGTAPAPARRLATACDVDSRVRHWGFGPLTYRNLLTAVRAREQLRPVGFVGYSFGSARLAYLAPDLAQRPLEWVALAHPFPVGASANELITARADATRLLAAGSGAGATGSADRPTRRRLPVTRFDELSAMVELGYLPDAAQPAAIADITSGRRSATVADLSDQLWQRYGTDSLAPGYLAQLDELCPLLGQPTITGNGSVAAILGTMLLPCGARGAPPPRSALGATSVCIVLSPADTVTPAALVERAYRQSSPYVRFVATAAHSHRSADGLDQCLPG